MAVLRITNFGGEIPRISPRALPPDSAQTNSNLLATSQEFRPLQDDSTVAGATSGSKTLYRFSRTAGEVYQTSDTANWITETADKNYVKGQLNDDTTERTYVSFNDGTAALRVMSPKNAVDRPLGVPPPSGVTATLNGGAYFTMADANYWFGGTLVPTVYASIVDPTVKTESRSLAGVLTTHSLLAYSASELAFVSGTVASTAAGLDSPQIYSISDGVNRRIPIACHPLWGAFNTTRMGSILGAVNSPRATTPATPVFTSQKIAVLSNAVTTYFSPTDASVQPLRDQLDAAVASFATACAAPLTALPNNPTVPAAPNKPEWITVVTEQNGVSTTMDPDWAVYRTAQTNYQTDLNAYDAADKRRTNEIATRNAAIVTAQATAKKLVDQIGATYAQRLAGLQNFVESTLTDMGLLYNSASNPNGLVTVDPDKITETRSYFITYVTDWGEESAPSNVTAQLDVAQKDTVTVAIGTAMSPVYANIIKKWRLYRTNTGSATTEFQFVSEQLCPATSVIDVIKSSALGEVCPTITWLQPPYRVDGVTGGIKPGPNNDPYLKDLVGMPNGVMAAHMDNFVAFCEPYVPYAWPVEYQIPIEFPIVGKGVFGQTLFVGTYANPYLISGSDSASMSAQKLDSDQACLSRRSIVAMQGGVLYASPDGICYASPAGVEVISTGLFAKEDWLALNPASIIAVAHEGVYYFWYTGTYKTVTGGCLALDMVAKKLVRVNLVATAVFKDIITDAVFYVSGTSVKRAFSTGRRTGLWKSGRVVLPRQSGFSWLQVDGDQSVGTPVTVTWHRYKENAAGVLIDDPKSYSITNTQPTRVHDGQFVEHEIEISSGARLTKVGLYGSTQELQSG